MTEASFPSASRRQKGYDPGPVDAFLARAREAFEADASSSGEGMLHADDVRTVAFPLVKGGYAVDAVDAALSRVEDVFAAREREAAISALGAEEWVTQARADAQVILDRLSRPQRERFARAGWLQYGYRIDEVDVVTDKLRAYFEDGTRVTAEQVRGIAFRMQRRGYREEQVDAVLDAVVEVMLAVS